MLMSIITIGLSILFYKEAPHTIKICFFHRLIGSQLLQRNTSILVRVSGKERTAIFVSDVLRMQTVETWKRSQTSWTALSDSISMVASRKENSEVIVKIVKRLQWLSVSIIYQSR